MRQTVIKDGIQARLQDLLGSEYNDSANYSIQSSMMENLTRVCKAIVGNDTNGKVMSGMTIDAEGQKVTSGYAITSTGKVIQFLGDKNFTFPLDANTRVNIYAVYATKYKEVVIGTPYPLSTGYDVSVIRGGERTLIIKDQIGAAGDHEGETECLAYNVGGIQKPTADSVYIGTIIIDSNGVKFVTYSNSNAGNVSYTYNTNVKNILLWTGTGTSADCFTNTHKADSMCMIDNGDNNLKKVRLVFKNKTTNSMPRPISDADQYKTRMKIVKYNSVGSYIGESREFMLNDCVGPFSFDVDVNEIINGGGYVGVSLVMNATTTASRFTSDATSGYADIQYVIEKLN
jgi:hypothetical protein